MINKICKIKEQCVFLLSQPQIMIVCYSAFPFRSEDKKNTEGVIFKGVRQKSHFKYRTFKKIGIDLSRGSS